MREIKFRGKDINTGEWRYGSYIYQPVFASAFPQDGRTPPKETATRIYMPETFESDPKICSVDPFTVGQYTGLKDKNGVEIYEGDILDSHYMGRGVVCIGDFDTDFESRVETPENLCGIYFKRCWALSGDKTDALSWRNVFDTKVVGNIHDSPELLK